MIDIFPREWEIELAISGPIKISSPMTLPVLKGENNPFMTPVRLRNAANGVSAWIVVRAYDLTGANDAAVYFVGLALDYLCLKIDLPLYLSLFRQEFRPHGENGRTLVTQNEWLEAFDLGRRYSMSLPYTSRAMSWYRKAMVSEDPMDKVIGFWSALEGVAATCHERNEDTKKGIINQVCNCFDYVWGKKDQWPVIPNQPEVINQFHKLRNGISHGFIRVDVETIRELVNKLPLYKELTRTFLTTWETSGQFREMEAVKRAREKDNQIPIPNQ